ncbi:acylphosphatase [Chloroflexia bacterium SDU3-3]|nr:acylphosphatase [Chloroflexia bacterium SDU3-3]
MEDVRAQVVVSGRVQGVYFRVSTQDQARAAGVRGWVRNLPDGRVQAVFEGSAAAVRQMIDWCHEGPDMAHVDHVAVEWQTPQGEGQGFRIR